ncbi:hypothetical protein ES707_08449 [subsurface metagenome]
MAETKEQHDLTLDALRYRYLLEITRVKEALQRGTNECLIDAQQFNDRLRKAITIHDNYSLLVKTLMETEEAAG